MHLHGTTQYGDYSDVRKHNYGKGNLCKDCGDLCHDRAVRCRDCSAKMRGKIRGQMNWFMECVRRRRLLDERA